MRETILARIRSSGSPYGVTAADLVAETGRSRALVGRLLKDLVEEGLIYGETIPTGKAGRPPLAYYADGRS